MLFTNLETDRLLLRNIGRWDSGFLLDHFSHSEVNRYLFDAEPLTELSEADEIIRRYLQPEPREQHRWILVTKGTGDKIGTCGFHRWDRESGTCEVGYDLSPVHQGKGYMHEALEAALSFARDRMKARRIDAVIYPENRRSVALAERCGFVFRGQVKDEVFRGKRYEHRIYTLTCVEKADGGGTI